MLGDQCRYAYTRLGTLDTTHVTVAYEVKWLNGYLVTYRTARHKYIIFIVITQC